MKTSKSAKNEVTHMVDEIAQAVSEPFEVEDVAPYELETFTPPVEDGFSKKSAGRVPPFSKLAEQSVLGAILLDNKVIDIVLDRLSADDFYIPQHRQLYITMQKLHENGDPIDVISVIDELTKNGELSKAGGVEYINSIIDAVPTSANVVYYCSSVKEKSTRRSIINMASKIVEECFVTDKPIDQFVDEVESRIMSVSHKRHKDDISHISDIVKGSIQEVEKLCLNKEPITGLATGFKELDSITSGLQKSDLIIVAARPSMGKTSFALNIAKNVALDPKHNANVLVFSLEMSKEQIVTRLLCSEARISNSKVRSGQLDEGDFPALVDSASKLAQCQILIDDTPAISVLELRAKARRAAKENKLDLIIVDYLQLMRGSSSRVESRVQEISEISRSLKAVAKELNIPVIALSQLNRSVESRDNKRPNMSDIRESGAIEQDADIICFIYRDEVYNEETEEKGVAEIIISKHRNGPIGTVKLAFAGEYTTFNNFLDEEDYQDYMPPDDDNFF